MLMAELWGLIAVVQAIIVAITLPTLLDASAVLAGKFPWLALGRRDVRWVGFAGDTIIIQYLIFSTGTLSAPRNSKAEAAAAPIIHTTGIGTHLLLLGIIHSNFKNGWPFISQKSDRF